MQVHLETERLAVIATQTGRVNRGTTIVSAITLDGGTAGTGATVVLNASTDGGGTDRWAVRAPQYGSIPVPFPKPIKFEDGLYITLTGTGSRVSIAYT